MQSPTRINPEIKDPSISDFPMTDDPSSPKDADLVAVNDEAADKSMPSQSGPPPMMMTSQSEFIKRLSSIDSKTLSKYSESQTKGTPEAPVTLLLGR